MSVSNVETAADRIAAMQKVLLHIQNNGPLNELTFEEKRILKECYDAKYFTGAIVSEMASGKIVVDYRFAPKLTLAGLQFLAQSEEADHDDQPAERDTANSDQTESKKFYQRGIFWGAVSGIASIVAIAVTLLIHFNVI